tara:strand:- start:497 stop:751 length:255 start_codon:yes stop_codon:yes gene_type:complete
MGRPKKIKQDTYSPTKDDVSAMAWCLDNKIRIYPVPKNGEYQLEIETKQNSRIVIIKSPESYPKDNYNAKIYELYRYMRKKNNK